MKELFYRSIALKKKFTAKEYRNPPKEALVLNEKLDELLKVGCARFNPKQQALVKRLIKNRESIFIFLSHPDVLPS